MIFVISVTVATSSMENATAIAMDRLTDVVTDYGFDYVLGDPIIVEAVPKPFEEYTEEELLSMPQEEFDELVGTDINKMNRDQLRIALLRVTPSSP